MSKTNISTQSRARSAKLPQMTVPATPTTTTAIPAQVKTPSPNQRRRFVKKTGAKPKRKPAMEPQKKREDSILVTGFGIRNLASLQNALEEEEKRKQAEILRYLKEQESMNVDLEYVQLLAPKIKPQPACEDEEEEVTIPEEKGGFEFVTGESEAEQYELVEAKSLAIDETSAAMRRAQNYLKKHKIVEFFKFLSAHLLSDVPDNPIEFLLDLLDKCLAYRAGTRLPPLLFEKKHLDRLFFMMDRMKTGFIEKHQYYTGMITIGVKIYNKNPNLSPEGLVAKETFVEEAYKRLVEILNAMIKPHKKHIKPENE